MLWVADDDVRGKRLGELTRVVVKSQPSRWLGEGYDVLDGRPTRKVARRRSDEAVTQRSEVGAQFMVAGEPSPGGVHGDLDVIVPVEKVIDDVGPPKEPTGANDLVARQPSLEPLQSADGVEHAIEIKEQQACHRRSPVSVLGSRRGTGAVSA